MRRCGRVLLVTVAAAGCSSAEERSHKAPAAQNSSHEAIAQPQPPTYTTTVENSVPTNQQTKAQDIARRLVTFCTAHDPHRDTWAGLEQIIVGQDDVFHNGATERLWTIRAKFPPEWNFNVLRGNTLWFRAAIDGKTFASMKMPGAEVCGLVDDDEQHLIAF